MVSHAVFSVAVMLLQLLRPARLALLRKPDTHSLDTHSLVIHNRDLATRNLVIRNRRRDLATRNLVIHNRLTHQAQVLEVVLLPPSSAVVLEDASCDPKRLWN